MPEDLRPSPLADRHEALGARLTGFAGWRMPVSYEGTIAEHEAVRGSVGVFDVSHLGTVFVRGGGALDVVSRAFTNDPSRLDDGTCQYTLCCDDGGGIVDDLIVYRAAQNRFFVVPNAANTEAVVSGLERAAADDVAEVVDRSVDHAILAIQGPDSLSLIAAALELRADELDYMQFREVELHGYPAWLCRTGYTGEVGCEIVLPAEAAGRVWDAVVEAGASPAGLAARDTLRLEMGYPLHGNDITPNQHPYEARLGWAVKIDHGPFRGQEALRRLAEDQPDRLLRGLRGAGRRPPRNGMRVSHDDEEVGEVTSGSYSPTLGVGIGLAYLRSDLGSGTSVSVDVRGSGVEFEVVDPPFVEASPRG